MQSFEQQKQSKSMKSFNEDYIQRRQVLSSLVLNVPYRVEGFDTAPKISKLLTFPFGIRIDSLLLYKYIFKFVSGMSVLMVATCILITCFYLPLKYQNIEMSKNARMLTNKQFALLAKVQETSSYNKLFTNANSLRLEDSKEIINLRNNTYSSTEQSGTFKTFSKYPSIHFSGF